MTRPLYFQSHNSCFWLHKTCKISKRIFYSMDSKWAPEKKKKPSRKQVATDCCYWIGVSFFRVWLVLGYQYSISSLSMCLMTEIVKISLSQRKRLWSWKGDMAEWWGEVEQRYRYRQMQLNKIIERSIPICLAVNVQHYTNSMISLEVYFLFLWCFLFCLFAFVFILLTALYF